MFDRLRMKARTFFRKNMSASPEPQGMTVAETQKVQSIKISRTRDFTARPKPGVDFVLDSNTNVLEIEMTSPTEITYSDGRIFLAEPGDTFTFRSTHFGISVEVRHG